jgi:hypothetical protein
MKSIFGKGLIRWSCSSLEHFELHKLTFSYFIRDSKHIVKMVHKHIMKDPREKFLSYVHRNKTQWKIINKWITLRRNFNHTRDMAIWCNRLPQQRRIIHVYSCNRDTTKMHECMQIQVNMHHTCIFTSICIDTCILILIDMHTCMSVYMYTYDTYSPVYAYIHAYFIHVCIHTYIFHLYMHTYMHIHLYMYTYMPIHVNIHVYMPYSPGYPYINICSHVYAYIHIYL